MEMEMGAFGPDIVPQLLLRIPPFASRTTSPEALARGHYCDTVTQDVS